MTVTARARGAGRTRQTTATDRTTDTESRRSTNRAGSAAGIRRTGRRALAATLLAGALAVGGLGQGAFTPTTFALMALLVAGAGVAAVGSWRAGTPMWPGTEAPGPADSRGTEAPGPADSRGTAASGPAVSRGTDAPGSVVSPTAGTGVRRPGVPRGIMIAAGCWVAFALWALLRAALAGDIALALPTTAVALVLAIGIAVTTSLDESGRALVRTTVIGLAVLVAALGWLGTVLHLQPLSLVSAGLWRASSSLTYANAAGSLLVTGLLLALITLPTARTVPTAATEASTPATGTTPATPTDAAHSHATDNPLSRRAIVAALLLGLAATMSRGAVLALAVGLVVLVIAGAAQAPGAPRARLAAGLLPLRGLLPVVPAVALACAGLLPTLPEASAPHPLLALAGLTAGAAVLLLTTSRRTPPDPRPSTTGWSAGRAGLLCLAAAVGLLVAGLLTGTPSRAPVGAAVGAIAETRITGTSADRVDLARVTLEQFAQAPVAGVGPARLDLTYVDHAGRLVQAWFTHLEYLQVAAETGLVGLALVLAGAVALALAARRPAALALLAAFAVQSALDFLWHIPALPLVTCVAVALLTPAVRPTTPQEHP